MTPLEILEKHKITVRSRPCNIPSCRCLAYYYHEARGFVCSSHCLDLANIGQVEFFWSDYPEVWERTGILLASGGRKNYVKGE
jgi:hypothetical protein